MDYKPTEEEPITAIRRFMTILLNANVAAEAVSLEGYKFALARLQEQDKEQQTELRLSGMMEAAADISGYVAEELGISRKQLQAEFKRSGRLKGPVITF